MEANCGCRKIVNEGFEGVALALGGIAASYDIPEEAVWDLARAIDLNYGQVRARLSKSEYISVLDDLPESGCGHPAVTYLLQRLKSGRSETGGGCREE